MRSSLYFFLLFLLSVLTCCTSQDALETQVYFDDFEDDIPEATAIDTLKISYDIISERHFNFNGSRNLGRFGTGGVIVELEGLLSHQWIRVSFDFYLHDKWEGNGLRGNGEDVVIFNIDQSNLHFSSIVNTKCLGQGCPEKQSFPQRIGEGSNPENAGVTDERLPGVCHFQGEIGGSKLIKFANRFPHSSETLRINIAAGIKDAGQDLCLKSWSIDNLKISTISLPQ